MLEEWTQSESLRKHGMAVSICAEAYGLREAEQSGLTGDAAAPLLSLMPVQGCCTIWTTSGIHRRGASICGVADLRELDGRSPCCRRSWRMRTTPA